MSSIKCMKCGLTNFADATECKRCGLMFVTPPGFPQPPTANVSYTQQPVPMQPNNYAPQMPMPTTAAYPQQMYPPNYQQAYPPNPPQQMYAQPSYQMPYNAGNSSIFYNYSEEKSSGSFLFKSFIWWISILILFRFYSFYKAVDIYTQTTPNPLSKSPMYNMAFYVEMGYSLVFLIFVISLYIKYFNRYKSFVEIAKGFLICNVLYNLIDIVLRLIFIDELRATIKNTVAATQFSEQATFLTLAPIIPIAISAFMFAGFIRLSDDDIDNFFYYE